MKNKTDSAGYVFKNVLSIAVFGLSVSLVQGWALSILLGGFLFSWFYIFGECLISSQPQSKQEKYLQYRAEKQNQQ